MKRFFEAAALGSDWSMSERSVNFVNTARLYSHVTKCGLFGFFYFFFLLLKKKKIFPVPLVSKVSRLGAFCVTRLADGLTCAIVRDTLTSSLKGVGVMFWGRL